METPSCLVIRLAGPLQSWGVRSQFKRRETTSAPTKSGIVGLLAAAQGRARRDPIDDLLCLTIGVRTDQSGSLLRDYHTVSDYRGVPLPSARVNAKGMQERTKSATNVTERYYLQDAVFVAAVGGPSALLGSLFEAMMRPAFPLALGRRACVPTQPLVLRPADGQQAANSPGLWTGDPLSVLKIVPWQASAERVQRLERREGGARAIDLPVVVDDPAGDDIAADVPRTFDPAGRSFTERPVRHMWVSMRASSRAVDQVVTTHDPFTLLRW
jgi:CRISPR system Cascade subunit CasD